MEVVECDNVESPDSWEDMALALNEGYLANKRLMDRLEQMLLMSKLPADVKNFASVVVEYYNDAMESVLDMMDIVTELIKEYAHLVQVHYGLRMGEELHRVKNIFLEACRVVHFRMRLGGGSLWIAPEEGTRIVRALLQAVVDILKVLVGDLSRLIRSVKSACQKLA